MRKFAFTLAEVMIVLAILGVLTTVLLPVAFNAKPDKNIMKFKKANQTLFAAVRQMITSDLYFNGSFAHMYSGECLGDNSLCAADNKSSNLSFFCNAMADIITNRGATCKLLITNEGYNIAVGLLTENSGIYDDDLSDYTPIDQTNLLFVAVANQPLSALTA